MSNQHNPSLYGYLKKTKGKKLLSAILYVNLGFFSLIFGINLIMFSETSDSLVFNLYSL